MAGRHLWVVYLTKPGAGTQIKCTPTFSLSATISSESVATIVECLLCIWCHHPSSTGWDGLLSTALLGRANQSPKPRWPRYPALQSLTGRATLLLKASLAELFCSSKLHRSSYSALQSLIGRAMLLSKAKHLSPVIGNTHTVWTGQLFNGDLLAFTL